MDQGDTLNATEILHPLTKGVTTTANGAVDNSTTLTVADSSPSVAGSGILAAASHQIRAGAKVEYIGGDEDLYVTNVSGNTLTLSERATIADGTSLTFKHQYPRYAETNTDVEFIHTGSNTDIFDLGSEGKGPQPIYHTVGTDGSSADGFWIHERALAHRPVNTMWQLHTGKSDQDANKLLSSVAQGYAANGRGTLVCTSTANAQKFQVGQSYIIQSGSEVVGNNGVPFTVLSVSSATVTIKFGVRLLKSYIRYGKYSYIRRRIYYPVKNLTASTQNETYTVRKYVGPTTSKSSRYYRKKPKTENFTVDITETTVTTTGAASFSIQNMYYNDQEDNYQYWGENHRLLDTAYTMSISQGNPLEDTDDCEYIIKGKFINCHNYDNSYEITNDTDIASFRAGDSVTIGSGANLKTINNLVACTSFKQAGVEKILIGNREAQNNVMGTRIYTLNQSTNIREEGTIFLPYLIKDMWVDETGTYIWTVDTMLRGHTGIQDTNVGGRIRRFSRTTGDNASTNATITMTHTLRFGGMVPVDGAERLIEPGGIWGEGNDLFVYYPATVAQPRMDGSTLGDSIESFAKITTQKSYLVKFDITGHAAETGELSTGVSEIVDIVHSGDSGAELPLNTLSLDGNPNTNVLISGYDQPNYSHEQVVNNPGSMASDGTTLWVLDRQLDANQAYHSMSSATTTEYDGKYTRNFTDATFHLLKKQNTSSSYFNYSDDVKATASTYHASKFGTGNIYAFKLADGTRDPDKDILITKNACKDGCYLGNFKNTSGTQVARTGGAAVPVVGDFLEDTSSLSTMKIIETSTERNLTNATTVTIDAVYGIPASDGLSKDPTDPTAVEGTYNLTSADYTYSATAPHSMHQPTIQVVVNSSGVVTGITVGDHTTTSYAGSAGTNQISRLFQVGHTVTITAGKLGTGSAAHTFTVTALTHYNPATIVNISLSHGINAAIDGSMAAGTLSTGYGNRASHLAYHGNKLYVLNSPMVNVGHYKGTSGRARPINGNAWVNIWSTTNKRWESDYINITGGVDTSTDRISQNFSGIAVDSTHLYVAGIQVTLDWSPAPAPVMTANSTDLRFSKITRYQLSDKTYQSTNLGYLPNRRSDQFGSGTFLTHAENHLYMSTGLSILPGVTQTIDSVTVPVFVTMDTLGSLLLGSANDDSHITGGTGTTTSKLFLTNHYTSGSTTNWSKSYDFGIPKTDLRSINLNKPVSNFTLCDIDGSTTDRLIISQALAVPMGGPFNYFTGKVMHTQRSDFTEPHLTPTAYVQESTTVGSAFPSNSVDQTVTNRPLVYEDYENIVVLNKTTTQGEAATNASAFTANNYYKGGNRFRLNIEETHPAPSSGFNTFTCQANVSNSATFVVDSGARPEVGHTFYHPDPGDSDAQKGHTITAVGFTEQSAGQLHGADTTAGKDGDVDIRCSISEAVANLSDTTIVVADRTGMPTNFPFAACLEKHDKYTKEIIEVTSLNASTNTYTVVRNRGYMEAYLSDFAYDTNDFISIPKELVVYNKTSGTDPDVSGTRDGQLFLEITSEDSSNTRLETLSDGTTKPNLKVMHIGSLPNVANHYAILLSSPIDVQVNRAAKLGHLTNVTVTPNITIDQNDIVYAGSNNAVQYQFGGYVSGGSGNMSQPAVFATASFDFDDGHFTGLMLREAEVLYFAGKDKIKGVAYTGGHNVLDEFPDGGSVNATIKSIKSFRGRDGDIAKKSKLY